MQMTMRWFGDGKDTVSLEQIRQVPGVAGVVPALHTLPAGEVWPLDMILDMKKEIEAAGLTMECIESVNVHESIKLGDGDADKYIENYKECIRNLSKAGVKVICYNFMPVFDWTRTDLAMDMGNGATCLCYDGKQVEGKSPLLNRLSRAVSQVSFAIIPNRPPFVNTFFNLFPFFIASPPTPPRVAFIRVFLYLIFVIPCGSYSYFMHHI